MVSKKYSLLFILACLQLLFVNCGSDFSFKEKTTISRLPNKWVDKVNQLNLQDHSSLFHEEEEWLSLSLSDAARLGLRGNPSRMITRYFEDEYGKKLIVVDETYFKDGYITQTMAFHPSNSRQVICTYNRDSKNRVIEETVIDDLITTINKYDYNPDGSLKEKEWFSGEGGQKPKMKGKITFKYIDSSDKSIEFLRVEEYQQLDNSSDTSDIYSILYNFSDNQKLGFEIEKTSRRIGGNSTLKNIPYKITAGYDSSGKETDYVNYVDNHGGYVRYQQFNTFDSNSNLVKIRTVDCDPPFARIKNCTDIISALTYVNFDPEGNWTKRIKKENVAFNWYKYETTLRIIEY